MNHHPHERIVPLDFTDPLPPPLILARIGAGSSQQFQRAEHVDIAKNGASVNPGDVVVQFDTTTQQRTLEQKQSELKQAD